MSFVESFPKAPEADTPGPVKRVIKQVAALALNIMDGVGAAIGLSPSPDAVAPRKTHNQ